jgi:murein DD-endopeptidase MepM/ murein hydrolase activator NlpD
VARPEARLREKAVLTLIEVLDPAAPPPVGTAGRLEDAVLARGAAESDPHVKAALQALLRRAAGTLVPERTAAEITVTQSDGLVWTPFLRGMTHLKQVAPGVTLDPRGDPAAESAADLPVASGWTTPLVQFGKEEVAGIRLQPFGKPRLQETLLHTGQDVGGCMDGAGLYAIGPGVVRLVASGTDTGTLIVVEHRWRAGDDGLLTSLYMHAGGLVFVHPGEEVGAGQLLGTIGLSFSIENGGHFSHLHLGLYPGRFDDGHNYGYKPADEGLGDWLDPAQALPALIRGDFRGRGE